MGLATQIVLVIAAVSATFLYLRAGETLRLFGDGNKPGILDLFKSDIIRDKIKDTTASYDAKYNRLADGVKEQDSSMVDNYYTIVTDFYEYGWGESFHLAHMFDNEGHDESIIRHEQELARQVGITKDDKVLDVGCGVGGPARNIHLYTGADVTGVTINEYQIMRANTLTKAMKLDDKVHFFQGDFTKLDFADNTFDKAYSIEATCHATDLYDVYREVYRVLKPGGVFGSYEWLTTAKYNPEDPVHKQIMHNIAYGSGLPPMHNYDDVMIAAKKAGFEYIKDYDYALQAGYAKPWWYKLKLSNVSTFITHYFTLIMEKLGLAAEGSTDAHAMLLHAITGLVDGGETGTFTPMHMVLFRKPANASTEQQPAAQPAQAKETPIKA